MLPRRASMRGSPLWTRVTSRRPAGRVMSTTADLESFYHLHDENLTDRACSGLACFVARDNDPPRWRRACEQPTRVYCLGKCYRAPAAGGDPERPFIVVRAPEAIVLRNIADRGARTLDAFRSRAGYRALEVAVHRLPEEIVRSIETSELRGRGGAGYPTGRKWRAVFHES